MYLSRISNGGATPALISTLAFNESRLAVISENVANATTPGYRARQLDPRAFQRSLREALDRRDHPSKPFVVRDNGQVETGDGGYLSIRPSLQPPDHTLFHDGTNVSIEREMTDLAETAMTHELASELLLGYFNGIRKAIRGRL